MRAGMMRIPQVWGIVFFLSCAGCLAAANPIALVLLFMCAAWILVRLMGLEKQLLLLAAALVPFTLDLSLPGGHNVGLPGEALLVILSLCFVWSFVAHRPNLLIVGHPIVFSILILFMFKLMAAFFSSDPVVSQKSIIIETVFILSGFGASFRFFLLNKVNLFRFLEFLLIGLLLVAAYALIHYAVSDPIARSTAHMARPFYKDHTVFSAVQCLTLPLMLWYRHHQTTRLRKRMFTLLVALCVLAVFLAASRAAWLSLIFASVFWVACRFRLKSFGFLFAAFLISPTLVLSLRTFERLALSNRYDSSRFQSSLKEQALSVGNITSDVSNLERLNRWNCAWRMVRDRPITGFGPGTYQIAYLPYQRVSEMTRISVISPFFIKDGKGGTAHSEYFLLLAETGWPGLFSWLLLTVAACYTAHRLTLRFTDGPLRSFRIALMIGFSTFWFHALFNNFLTTVNFAWPFWLLLSTLFCLSVSPSEFIEMQYRHWSENK
jgi:O-antigen ligase